MIFTSEVVRCNVPNKNGRIYTKECIEKALENPIIKEQIENGCFFGGLMEDIDKETFTIDMSKVTHRLIKYWWNGDILFGEFDTIDTSKGMTLAQILSTQTKNFCDCMAPFGVGTLETAEDGNQIVEDYSLLSINYTEEKA